MTLSMRQRIKEGMLFTDLTEGLPEERLQGKELMYEYNHTRPSEGKRRKELIGQILLKRAIMSGLAAMLLSIRG
jgi:Maltose acetyltransferase.